MWNTNKTWVDYLLINLFLGKTIGILGVDNCGKSVLYNFIFTKKLKHGISSTDTREKTENVSIQIDNENYKIRLQRIFDVGGQRQLYPLKKLTFTTSDCIIYIVRSDLIINAEMLVNQCLTQKEQEELNDFRRKYKNGLAVDFENFKDWQENIPFWEKVPFFEKGKPSRIIVVGNHFGEIGREDTVPNFLDTNLKKDYGRNFRECFNRITGFFDESTEMKWVVGSLVSEKLANQLVLDILKSIN
ncbi:ADP-ribosylation factor-like protein [Nostoc sp. CCY 9925]|uniref:ADP-ribosylation factor-like protein n=1 Tax=Nostoc sp. CCY 9925 TaxID=3103865 RepID=UPI0039C64DE7